MTQRHRGRHTSRASAGCCSGLLGSAVHRRAALLWPPQPVKKRAFFAHRFPPLESTELKRRCAGKPHQRNGHFYSVGSLPAKLPRSCMAFALTVTATAALSCTRVTNEQQKTLAEADKSIIPNLTSKTALTQSGTDSEVGGSHDPKYLGPS